MYVYLIQSGDMKISPVKVGFSKNPEARLKQLQTGNPVVLKLIMKIKCDSEKHARNLEKSLHDMLGTQNVYLEWYKLKKTHIMKMLTAFSNDEDFDQVQHCENLNHYSSMPGDISIKRRYKNLLRHVKQMETALIRRKNGARIMRKYISEKSGMNDMDIKSLINEELDKGSKPSILDFDDGELAKND